MQAEPSNADWPRLVAGVRVNLFGLQEGDAIEQAQKAYALLKALAVSNRLVPRDRPLVDWLTAALAQPPQ